MRFAGKKALVTGAAGGIGQALVASLIAEGASVAASDLDSSGVKSNARLDGDLLDANFCDTLPGRAHEALGGLDLIFNNAGVITRGKITKASDADYALTMGVNVEAPFRICRAAIPLMVSGAAIVNTSSCRGRRPGPDHPLYVMSKAALASLTQCLGRDHAHQGIRVSAVCPNEVNTPMIRTGFEIRGLDAGKAISELNASVPLGQIAEPEDISDVALFLASDDARYMTGACVEVNGGKPGDMSRFAGKVALVTEASSGVGAATANQLAEKGARVFTAQGGRPVTRTSLKARMIPQASGQILAVSTPYAAQALPKRRRSLSVGWPPIRRAL